MRPPFGEEYPYSTNEMGLAPPHIEVTLPRPETIPNLAEFQEAAMDLLERLAVVERHGDDIVVDLDVIKQLPKSAVQQDSEGEYRFSSIFGVPTDFTAAHAVRELSNNFPEVYGNGASSFLFYTFYQKNVIDREAWSAWQQKKSGKKPVAKPLFYSPEDKAAAFDMEKIKQADFHLGLWETRSIITTEDRLTHPYSPLCPDASFQEVALACAIYHPDYGNGERDQKGRLVVTYNNTVRANRKEPPSRRPITQDWLQKNRYFQSSVGVFTIGDKKHGSPGPFMLDGGFSDLQITGLLLDTDFHVSVGETMWKFGEKDKTVSKVGLAMLEGVRYSLGRKYGKHVVRRISPTEAVICVPATERAEQPIVASFRLKTPEELSQAIQDESENIVWRQTNTSGYFDVLKSGITITPYAEKDDHLFSLPSLVTGGETSDMTGQELFSLDKIKKEIVRATGVSLEALTSRERAMFIRYYASADVDTKKKLHTFIRQFTLVGLQTFLAVQHDRRAPEKIFAIAEQFPDRAAQIFAAYGVVASVSQHIDAEIESFFVHSDDQEKADRPRITDEIMRRAATILERAATAKPEGIEGVVASLGVVEQDLEAFAAIFKATFKGREMRYEQVRGLSFESTFGDELSLNDKKSMVALSQGNYRDEPEVSKDFEKLLHPTKRKERDRLHAARFYLLKKHGPSDDAGAPADTYLATLSAEERLSGRVYIGNFNVAPHLKNSAIGENLLNTVIAEWHKTHTVDAVVVPENLAGTHYIEKKGFVATRFDKTAEHTRHGWFEISIPKEAEPSVLRGKTEGELMAEYIKKFLGRTLTDISKGAALPVVLLLVELPRDMDKMTDVSETLLNTGQYQLTRYISLDPKGNRRLLGFERAIGASSPDKKSRRPPV